MSASSARCIEYGFIDSRTGVIRSEFFIVWVTLFIQLDDFEKETIFQFWVTIGL